MHLVLLVEGKIMKFVDNRWRTVPQGERLELSKTEGQVRSSLLGASQTIVLHFLKIDFIIFRFGWHYFIF